MADEFFSGKVVVPVPLEVEVIGCEVWAVVIASIVVIGPEIIYGAYVYHRLNNYMYS